MYSISKIKNSSIEYNGKLSINVEEFKNQGC